MKRRAELGLQILMGTLILLSGKAAQAQTGGSISGTVRDPSGSVIPDIAVILHTTRECSRTR